MDLSTCQQPWIWTCERLIPSQAGAGRVVLNEILEKLKELNWLPHDVFSVHLAVEEALVNAIHHGNRLDSSKKVRVACRVSPNMLRIEITDEGSGFDPHAVPDPTSPDRLECPNGRGIMLMKNFMSRVAYNSLGNCVTLEKDRAKPDY
jgi:serine/threonine-protein kinase RsbW